MFPGLKQDGKKPVLNAQTELGAGRGCSQMLGMLLFLDLYGKNPVPRKSHSGTQTSSSVGSKNIFIDGLLMVFLVD